MRIIRWFTQWTRHWHTWYAQKRNYGEWSPSCKCGSRLMAYLEEHQAKYVCYKTNIIEKEQRKEWVRSGKKAEGTKEVLLSAAIEAKTGVKCDIKIGKVRKSFDGTKNEI